MDTEINTNELMSEMNSSTTHPHIHTSLLLTTHLLWSPMLSTSEEICFAPEKTEEGVHQLQENTVLVHSKPSQRANINGQQSKQIMVRTTESLPIFRTHDHCRLIFTKPSLKRRAGSWCQEGPNKTQQYTLEPRLVAGRTSVVCIAQLKTSINRISINV